jgi:hypothetical protein
MELTKPTSKELKLVGASVLIGFFCGGLLLGRSPEIKTLTEVVEVEKLVEIEKVVTVEKIVTKVEYLKAQNAQTIETRHTDGTVTIDSRYYGLQIDSFDSSNETVKDSLTVQLDEKVKSEKSLSTSTLNNSLSLHFYSPYSSILEFDYTRDWTIQYTRHILSSPFFGSISLGPKQFSLGLGFSF